ncbi:putative Zn-dependent protease [Hoeflea phototrophica DFL-43]|jgi:predicted Zn-dependent protease|uniref:Putative Zn-dependent protease n=1 Tax=Hoeflea phototrophica (strain DSM 17068 / NCIMB 14078 / DFL-43) TaxID=411684 RepID=A9D877_HOEPD|nr:M48 family metalloprotease [Hoeflea phototrophica]EDQ33240.1 putative Zn-dependent protease [Hoeflea phototrophica DFL-43]
MAKTAASNLILIGAPKRASLRSAAFFGTALLLAGCQNLGVDFYEPNLRPSNVPQTAESAGASDPRTRIGANEHPRIIASYGGEYRDAKTERLVARIVGALTLVSENPQQAYRITVLNSPAVNAFALPGGYLYVTRGLLALANDASEVAAVLSHEMAHVTANHGLERQRREQEVELAGQVAEELFSNSIAGRQVLARGKLSLAAFSRNQELQADVIGVRMLGEAGYDPFAAARFLESMDANQRFNSVDPDTDTNLDFLASHPNAPQRMQLAKNHARAFGPEGVGDRGRDYYLQGIDGLLFGDSPNEGYVRGTEFLHPVLGVRFSVPNGFRIDNKADAVLATGPRDLAVRFDGVTDKNRQALSKYIASGWVTGLDESSIRQTRISGLPAATARASADKWDFDITVIRFEDRIYRFLTAAPRGSSDLEPTASAIRSGFRVLSDREIQALEPLRIRIVTVAQGDTVASLAARMRGVERKMDLFRLLNAIAPGASLRAGQKVKIVSDR